MSEAQIQKRLARHRKRLAEAEKEGWFMPPIPLVELEWKLRFGAWRKHG